MGGEKGGNNHAINRQFGAAGHEGGQEDGHFTVSFTGKGPGRHNGRDAAPEADEHGDKGTAGKADLPQELIHDKGHPGHIAAVLQEGEEEEQQNDNGQEGKDAAHAGADPVDDQAADPVAGASGSHEAVQGGGPGPDAPVQEVLEGRAQEGEGQPEDHHHDPQENGDAQVPAGQDPVDALGTDLFPGLLVLDHTLGADLFDEGVAHVRQGGLPVGAQLVLHILNNVLDDMLLVVIQMKQRHGGLVALHQLGGGEAKGKTGVLGLIHHDVGDGVNGFVDLSLAEVVFQGRLLLRRRADSHVHQLVDALVFSSGNGDHGDAQLRGQLHHVDGVAAGPDLVHHVQGDDHGDAQLYELEGKVEVPLDVGGVHDVDDTVGMLVQDEIPGDDLLRGVGGEGVDAGEVHHHGVLALFDGAFLFFDGNAGEVPDVLVAAGQAVEKGGFAAVLVACQGEKQLHGVILSVRGFLSGSLL